MGGVNKLYPPWPASSPWVTAVGGTEFTNLTVGNVEMAWPGSGGGWSWSLDQPPTASLAIAAQKAYLAGAALADFPRSHQMAPSRRRVDDVVRRLMSRRWVEI